MSLYCQIVYLSLFNYLLSNGKLSQERQTVVFSKNKVVVKLSSLKIRQCSGKLIFERIVLPKNEHCLIVFLALYNFLLSTLQFSSEQWTIIFLALNNFLLSSQQRTIAANCLLSNGQLSSLNKSTDNFLLSTVKLSSEQWKIVFSTNEADKQKIFFLKYSHVVTCIVLIQTSFHGPARLVQCDQTEIRAGTKFLRS